MFKRYENWDGVDRAVFYFVLSLVQLLGALYPGHLAWSLGKIYFVGAAFCSMIAIICLTGEIMKKIDALHEDIKNLQTNTQDVLRGEHWE